MKVKHFFGLAVLAAMTASCSSNDELVNGGGTNASEAVESYATFSIKLPTVGGMTRAGSDPEFVGGEANEYDVNNATLVIFQKAGAGEKDYKWVESVSLGNMAPWTKKDADGVTTEAKITAKLNSVNLTDDYYALVVLNNKDKNDADKVTLPETGDTYGTWNVAEKADGGKLTDNTKGFYMANAPHYVDATNEPETLVKVEKVYATKQAAESNAGTTIHVERGLAKVSVSSLPTNKTPSGSAYSNDKVDITAWNLDVTNKKSYPVHVATGLKTNFADIWKNESATDSEAATARFVDNTNTFKRVYWGTDPNYSTDLATVEACQGEFTMLADNAAVTGSADNPQYCLENTFDIKHMMQGQTTRVVFKATYKPAGINEDENFYKIGNNTDLWSETNLVAQIKAKAQEVLGETDAGKITVDLSATDNDIKGVAGTKILAAANVKHNETDVTGDQIDQINAKLGLKAATTTDPIVGIATYKSGECYYIARVKHFGDDLTPWDATKDDTYGDDNNENNKKYLGRYGVLRNNWYELSVNSVSGPGTPDIPDVNPTTPDDEKFAYINVSVKILDWAKRTQSVDL